MANEFLPFATAGGANVMSQADYAALSARSAGFIAGVALSAQLNKAWRQSASIAAMMGQLLTDHSGSDALDDGNIATLLNQLELVLQRQDMNFVQAGGTANAITVTLDPAPASLTMINGTPIRTRIASANTSGTVTYKVGALAAKPVKKPSGTDPAIGDLSPGIAELIYDLTSDTFILVSGPAASGTVPGANGFTPYTTAGTSTFTVPAGIRAIECGGVGGGGGGGAVPSSGLNAGTGGGAGGFSLGWYPVTPGQNITVIVGAAGAGGAVADAGGGNGGTTSVGSFISCPGGGGGSPNGISGGSSSPGTGGQVNATGGGGGSALAAAGVYFGGAGGGSWFGSGGVPSGGNAAPFGAGGSGGGSGGGTGGNGKNGYAWIRF